MPIISSLQLDSSCPVLPVTCPCPCPCPCPRSASGRGSSSTPAPAPSAASTLCCPRTSPSSLPGTSPAEPALLLLPLPHCTVQPGKGLQHEPSAGDRTEPWVHWPWEQLWDFSRLLPELGSSGLAAHKPAAFLAKGP